MLLADLAWHQLQDGRFDLDLRQVDRWQAVLLGDELGELLILDVAHARERRAEPLARPLGLVLRLLKLLQREHLLADEQLTNTAHSPVSPEENTTGFAKVSRNRGMRQTTRP